MTNLDEVKDKFFYDLDSIISETPITDKLIILCDFTASVGTECPTTRPIPGKDR